MESEQSPTFDKAKMQQWALPGALVLVLIIAFVFLFNAPHQSSPTSSATTTPTGTNSTTGTPVNQNKSKPTTTTQNPSPTKPGTVTPAPVTAIPQSFTVSADDFGATPTTITVPAGTSVTLTIGVDPSRTSVSGLDFRSSVINTDAIAPGAHKTITFTATKSFTLTPYIASTNTPKSYSISIVVK